MVNPFFLMIEDLMNWVQPSKKPKDCETLMTWVPLSNNSKDCKGNLSYKSIRLLLILLLIFWYPYSLCTPEAKYFTRFFLTPFNNFSRCPEANGLSWKRVKDSDRQLLIISMFVQSQPEIKNGHFISYTPYLVHEAKGIFYTIHRCH